MRRLWEMLLALALVFSVMVSVGAAQEPVLPAKAYLLMDGTTGEVLHEYSGYERLPMASTTKIMTAILALEQGNPADLVAVGQQPYVTGGATIYLEVGEQQTLSDLLLALMLESANDAGVAIAEHLAGSEERFAGWMNQKAYDLGARHTHFVNSHGLHHPDHYSTAYDLALITRYAMQNPAFRELVLVEAAEIPGYGQNPPRKLISRNRLLGYTDGANGVKNGWTEEAGLTNVASARRGDTELIAVVLGAENRLWTSSEALLEFGFRLFRTARVVSKNAPVAELRLPGGAMVEALASESLAISLREGEGEPEWQVEWVPGLAAPLEAGARVGYLTVRVDGTEAGRVELVASQAVVTAASAEARARRQPGESERAFFGLVGLVLLLVGAATGLTVALNPIRRVFVDRGKRA